MSFLILNFLFIYIFLILSIVGYGKLFFKFIYPSFFQKNFAIEGLCGLIFIGFISTFIHFVIPVSKNINILVLIIGFLIFILIENFKTFFFKKKNLHLFIFFVSIFMFYGFQPNEDFGYYHLPYIVNFTQEKIIFGLSNLQLNQGWNSMWLNISSMFYLPYFDYKGTFILNACLFLFISSLLIYQIFEEKNNSSFLKYFSSFFLLFFIIKFCRLNSYGLDVPGNFSLIIFLIFFILGFEKKFKNDQGKYSFFSFLFLLSVFSTTLRIINLLTLFLLIIFYYKKKLKIVHIIKNKVLIFSSVFGFVWLVQQFIYTSCLIFPSDFTCVKTSWLDSNIAENFYKDTTLVNRSFQSYKGNLMREEYMSNFNWLPHWFSRNKIELTEHILAFITPIIFYLIMSIKKSKKNKQLKNKDKSIFIYLIFFIILTFVWLTKGPVIRFGTIYIQSLIFIFVFYYILNQFNFNKKKFLILLIIALSFNLLRNLNRIIHEKPNFYPNIVSVKYEKNEKGIKKPVKQFGIPKSEYCWATPSLCSLNPEIITVENYNSYKIIKKLNF